MGFGDKIDALRDAVEAHSDGAARRAGKIFARREIKIVVCAFSALLVLSILITVIVSGAGRSDKEVKAAPGFRPDKIAEEDIFIAGEPDFLPEVLLEAKRKSEWKPEDAAPFWTDPAELGAEKLQKKLSETVDKLLERVP